MRFSSRLIRALVAASLALSAWFARRPRYNAITSRLMRGMAQLAIRAKGIRDREVLKHAGGQFVVLRSQAEAGRTSCEVAMRRAEAPTGDLVAAHRRTGRSP